MSGSSSVTGTDASIPLRAGQGVTQPVNPLQQLGQFATIQNQMNQNQLFPIIKQQQETQLAQSNLKFSMDVLQGMKSQVTSLLADDGPITPKKVIDAATEWAEQINAANPGYHSPITADGVIKMVSRFPMPDGDASDPTYQRTARAALKKMLASTLVPLERMQATLGSPAEVDQGSQMQPGMRGGPLGPNPGGITPSGPPIQRGLTPEAQVQPAPMRPATEDDVAKNPSLHLGQMITESTAQRAANNGQGGLVNPPPVGAPAPGDLPQSLRNSNRQPPATGGPVAPPGAPGVKPTAGANLPGSEDYMRNSAGDFATADQRARGYATDMFPLLQAQKALLTAPTGKGSEALHSVSSYINTFAPEAVQKALAWASPIMTKDQVAAYDEARKYLTQGQLGAPGATRSNEGLSTAGAATPGVSISKEAAQLVLQGMIGLRRMEQASVLEFGKSGKQPADWGAFSRDFATKANPAVYTFDMMSPDQRRKLLDEMPKEKRPQFWDQIHTATQNGIIQPPSAPSGQ